MDDEVAELRSQIDGLKIVLAVALNILPPKDVAERLRLMEDTARQSNMQSGTIEMIREFREKWNGA